MKLSVVMPAYNEIATIAAMMPTLGSALPGVAKQMRRRLDRRHRRLAGRTFGRRLRLLIERSTRCL